MTIILECIFYFSLYLCNNCCVVLVPLLVSLFSMTLLCYAKSLQLCLALCGLVDHSPPGSSVHGILQARILELVAVPSSRGIFPSWGLNQSLCVSCIGRQVPYH